MRVLVVTTWLPTAATPESGVFVERDIDLIAREHEVEVVHLSSDRRPGAVAVPWPVHHVPMVAANPLSVAAARRGLRPRLEGIDLVHTMAASTLLPFRRLDLSVPWVHTEHWSGLLAPSTVPLGARLAIPTTMRLLERPDVVVAVGRQLAAKIGETRRGPITVIPNAVASTAEPVPRREPDGLLRLVGVGGLVARKGPGLAIAAAAELVRRGHDVQLDWVGEGPMRRELDALVHESGLEGRVRFRGRLAPHEVGAVLGESDVFVLPTEHETFGVAIAEALAAGRPVVVGDVGEQAEFVREPDGVLVGERTATAYADGVERVLAANAGRSAADIAADVRSRFTEDARRTAYGEVYADAGRSSRARG
ncbi:glycosyltransferase involved in cell wall biosynthesis [Agromyces terreus]|uniref:Glycosyltransferase involved in cell wall biosynthesis n=1 Tax=Agromyces terreus TaxID=424795 RepID=A0A9X2H174_9MICO|nr:glycosyltransferase family 4 protein [Agromyces terreus]MCP2371301.1 glycosyltransferase involved in cell wall biosynthesis [Agromyces terreus]